MSVQPTREDKFSFGLWTEVQQALAAAKVTELATPTLSPGESWSDLRDDAASFEDFDVDAAGAQGYGFVKLHQLAIDHVLRAR